MDNIIKTVLILTEEVDKLKVTTSELAANKADKCELDWLNTQEVLKMLNISIRTLQNFRDNGTLPFSRIQNKFYYKISYIQQLLENNYSVRYKQLKNI